MKMNFEPAKVVASRWKIIEITPRADGMGVYALQEKYWEIIEACGQRDSYSYKPGDDANRKTRVVFIPNGEIGSQNDL